MPKKEKNQQESPLPSFVNLWVDEPQTQKKKKKPRKYQTQVIKIFIFYNN